MPKKIAKKKDHPSASATLDDGYDRERWELKLYIAGQTPKSLTAFSNLKRFCEENLQGKYALEVIDLTKNPHLAKTDQILAIPTLVRRLPEPMRKIIGDLSDKEKVLLGFDLKRLP